MKLEEFLQREGEITGLGMPDGGEFVIKSLTFGRRKVNKLLSTLHCHFNKAVSIGLQSGWSVCRTGKTETKQHPSMLPCPAVPGSCLVSFCFLCDIHSVYSTDLDS